MAIQTRNDPVLPDARALAERFHEAYERLAPSYGYETRPDTKAFDPFSANGRLMIAVCGELTTPPASDTTVPGGQYEARFVAGGAPTDCVDYGVVSLTKGVEVCRVWQEDDARLIANLLNAAAAPKVASDTDVTDGLGTKSFNIKLGVWTLRIYPGRMAGTLPSAAPEITLYKGVYNERKGIEEARERLTPWDKDFASTLLDALRSAQPATSDVYGPAYSKGIVERAIGVLHDG